MHDKIHLLFITLFLLTSGPFSMFIHDNVLREKTHGFLKMCFRQIMVLKAREIYLVIEQGCACKSKINDPFKTQFFIKMSFTSKN